MRNGYNSKFGYRRVNHPIFGVEWDRSSSPSLTRINNSQGMTANVGVDDEVVTNDFDNADIFREIHDVEDSLGNAFARIPKFYIKKEVDTDYRSWQISKTRYNGFYLPKVFWDFDNNRELPYFDFGKHKATKDGDNKLQSTANEYPLVNQDIVDFRTYAENNNTDGLSGYQQLDIHAIDVLRTLMFIEFGTLNIQSVMAGYTGGEYNDTHTAVTATTDTNTIIVSNDTGSNYRVGQAISVGSSRGNNSVFYGRTITAIDEDAPETGKTTITFDGDAVSIAVDDVLYNTGWKNGFSSDISATSGSINSNSSGKYPCVYRGVESPFGDVWQFVDGVNINDWQAWVCENAKNYASNLFAEPYKQLGYINNNSNGYVSIMGYDDNYPYAEFPVEIAGSSSTYYSDYYYENDGQRIALFGAYWSFGSGAGVSGWGLSLSSGHSYVYVGGRLLKKPL